MQGWLVVYDAIQGMRFCELIKDDLAALAELPESTPELEVAPTVVPMTYRQCIVVYFQSLRSESESPRTGWRPTKRPNRKPRASPGECFAHCSAKKQIRFRGRQSLTIDVSTWRFVIQLLASC